MWLRDWTLKLILLVVKLALLVLLAQTSILVPTDDPRGLVSFFLKALMMPAMPSSNSMALTGKAVSLRFAKIVLPMLADFQAAAVSTVVDLAEALAAAAASAAVAVSITSAVAVAMAVAIVVATAAAVAAASAPLSMVLPVVDQLQLPMLSPTTLHLELNVARLFSSAM